MPILLEKKINEELLISVWNINESLSDLDSEKILHKSEKVYYDSLTNSNRKKQWLLTRYLLNNYFVDKEYIVYNSNGKPKLNNGFNIGISHTKEYVSIILSKKFNVALDVEKCTSRILKVKHKFIKYSEIRETLSQHEEIIYYTIIWSVKETLCKLFDYKIFDFINNLTVLPFNINHEGLIKARAVYKSNVYEISVNYFMINDSVLTWASNRNEHLSLYSR